jgi:hypothetical protein
VSASVAPAPEADARPAAVAAGAVSASVAPVPVPVPGMTEASDATPNAPDENGYPENILPAPDEH